MKQTIHHAFLFIPEAFPHLCIEKKMIESLLYIHHAIIKRSAEIPGGERTHLGSIIHSVQLVWKPVVFDWFNSIMWEKKVEKSWNQPAGEAAEQNDWRLHVGARLVCEHLVPPRWHRWTILLALPSKKYKKMLIFKQIIYVPSLA